MATGTRDRKLRTLPAGSAAVSEDMRRLNDGGYRAGATGGYGDGTGDLFAWGARQKRYRTTGSISVRQGVSAKGAYGIESSRSPGRRGGLGPYLYSGSFGRSAPPSAREHTHVTRNRVVFLAVVLGLALFIMHRIMTGG